MSGKHADQDTTCVSERAVDRAPATAVGGRPQCGDGAEHVRPGLPGLGRSFAPCFSRNDDDGDGQSGEGDVRVMTGGMDAF